MMLLVVVDVSGRYLFNKPIAGNIELTEILMVLTIYSGIAYTQRNEGHVGMDLIFDKLKGKFYYLNRILLTIISLLINIVVMIFSYEQAIETFRNKSTSMYLHLPMWILPVIVSVGTLTLCLRLLLECIQSYSALLKIRTSKKQP